MLQRKNHSSVPKLSCDTASGSLFRCSHLKFTDSNGDGGECVKLRGVNNGEGGRRRAWYYHFVENLYMNGNTRKFGDGPDQFRL